MPNVWMDEAPKVQTVGADGIGAYPPVPVGEKEKITGNVRGVEKTAPANSIPNPGTVNAGDAIIENNGVWGSGAGGGGGSGGDSNVLVGVLVDNDGTWTTVSYNDVKAAILAGKLVYFVRLYTDTDGEYGSQTFYRIYSYDVSSQQYTLYADDNNTYFVSNSPDTPLSMQAYD